MELIDIEEEKLYTLIFMEGFGTKYRIYYNAEAFFKTEDGCGFKTFADGYMFIPKDRIFMEVKSNDTYYVEALYKWEPAITIEDK